MTRDGDRTLLIDASVCVTLAAVGGFDLLDGLRGDVVIPRTVRGEVTTDPARTALEDGWIRLHEPTSDAIRRAAVHLGVEREPETDPGGDIALLATAVESYGTVVVTDDKPLRKTCKALSIPVSGSLGVLIRPVERGDIDAADAEELLYAMDEVGARLSASLVRRAERLIDEASDHR